MSRQRSEELDTLEDLIDDFPAADPPSVEQAQRQIQSKYQSFEDEEVFRSLQDRLDDVESFPQFFRGFARRVHEQLYKGILSNAGEYRDELDPYRGQILFGPMRRDSSLKGAAPSKIEAGLEDAFSYLIKDVFDPIKKAITFYQRFLNVHPFYDANGRIARLIVTLYLDYHGYYIQWAKLDNDRKLFRKLNKCHKRQRVRGIPGVSRSVHRTSYRL
jgi:fido (protein-threonine AMPylation protein)